MGTQPVIDRQLLGDPGLALDDDTYVPVVAGMGMSWYNWTSAARGAQHSLCWRLHNFRIELKQLGSRPGVEWLLHHRDAWVKALGEAAEKRVLIEAAGFGPREPDLGVIVRILNHPAAGAESVFVRMETPQADLRWQWPLRIGAFPADLEALGLGQLGQMWPSQSLVEVQELTRQQARCEVLVLPSSVRDGLRRILELPHRVRACHLVLLGPVDIAWRDLRSHAEALLAETQAGALTIVSLPPSSSVPKRLNCWVEELSHNEPLDFALARAFPRESSMHLMDLDLLDRTALTTVAQDLGRRLKRLPGQVAFQLPARTAQRLNVGWTTDQPPAELGVELETRAAALPFDRESRGATGLSEISVAERRSRREAAQSESPRYLQGDLFTLSEGAPVPETRGFTVGRRYRLDVFIGKPGEGAITADRAFFPDEQLDWREKDSFTLQVLFAEPRQWDEPLQGTLVLPRAGRSSKCRFVFSPAQPGPFCGRVTVCYRGRVLQTALLEAVVAATVSELAAEQPAPLRFAVEAELRRSLGTLDDRRRFDACLVLNQTAAGTPAMTAASGEGAYIASLDGIQAQLAAINGLLNQVALNSKRYATGLTSKNNAELLCQLAREGHWIYRNLVLDYLDRSSAVQALRDSDYLQIVSTKPDAIVPLEFVYAYPPPKPGAPVCEHARKALLEGRCAAGCEPKQSPAAQVCPLGFWGLRKVIERHLHDPKLPQVAQVKSEPIAGRDVLALQGSSLLAASEQVPQRDVGELERDVRSAWKGTVAAVRKWADWPHTVQTTKPVVLLVLPHAEGAGSQISLEISGDVLASDYIDRSYVCGDPDKPPIALLLGCDTTNVAYTEAYARHIAVFRQANAAVVLGTVATVLGADAAKVARKLVRRLAAAAGSTERFGEVLLRVKREAVAESLMMAMCLVAFGDADWRLE